MSLQWCSVIVGTKWLRYKMVMIRNEMLSLSFGLSWLHVVLSYAFKTQATVYIDKIVHFYFNIRYYNLKRCWLIWVKVKEQRLCCCSSNSHSETFKAEKWNSYIYPEIDLSLCYCFLVVPVRHPGLWKGWVTFVLWSTFLLYKYR